MRRIRSPSGGQSYSSHKNVILCADTKTVKLLDFGLAELSLGERQQSTDLGSTAGQKNIVGTPHYVAPELWRGAPANCETDIYAVGVLLYILATGKPPYPAGSPSQLKELQKHHAPPLLTAAPGFEARLAEIIDCCLELSPRDRFHSGGELREALEALVVVEDRARPKVGNPYRGLRSFESEQSNLFFGRSAEVREVLDRLRGENFIAVAGDSGVGKSSLCRAGVAPHVVAGALEPERTWRYGSMIPGQHPLSSLLAVFVTHFDLDEETVLSVIKQAPEKLRWMIHERLGHTEGRLIFIDQLEELTTISASEELEIVGQLLAQLTIGMPGVRLLCSVRGDFLTRVAQVPHLGTKLSQAIYLLRPLSRDSLRSAIVGPAQAFGVSYESDELVEELVLEGEAGSLPILQFALAELWKARPIGSLVLTSEELRRIGGVSGALARHADGMLSALSAGLRVEVRKLLIRLVTIDDTRASLSSDALGDDKQRRTALMSLVEQRLVVVRETETGPVYELAHEALINGWGTLRHWLDEEQDLRALRHRLGLSAEDWKRLGKSRSVLWNRRQVEESTLLDRASLRPVELDFLTASVRGVRRRRWMLRTLVVGIPLLLASSYAGVRLQSYRDLQARVDNRVARASDFQTQAESANSEQMQARFTALEHFKVREVAKGEKAWELSLQHGDSADTIYMNAAREFEAALALDPSRRDVAEGLADVLFSRALLAESLGRNKQATELLSRLDLYDRAGLRTAKWYAPGALTLTTEPAGVDVQIERYEQDSGKQLVATKARHLGQTPLQQIPVEQGSYRLTLNLPGHAPLYLPFQVGRDEAVSLALEVPQNDVIPEGFVYIPAGSFWFGSRDEIVRTLFTSAAPLQRRETSAYLIARYETTFGDWIAFLDDLPEAERERYIPKVESLGMGMKLTYEDNRWRLTMNRGEQSFSAWQGDALHYPTRTHHQHQDWLRIPVSGMNANDALDYLKWLDTTGKVPGARLCTGLEWERAARGGDDRTYPQGYDVDKTQANIDASHERDSVRSGPDAVGSYPQSASPFGVEGLVGNVAEWTHTSLGGEFVIRGGAFFMQKFVAQSVNRTEVDRSFRELQVGLRVCTSYPRSPRTSPTKGG